MAAPGTAAHWTGKALIPVVSAGMRDDTMVRAGRKCRNSPSIARGWCPDAATENAYRLRPRQRLLIRTRRDARGGITAMASVIMVYSTTDGHTRKICERLRDVIERQEHEVTLAELKPGSDIDLGPYE